MPTRTGKFPIGFRRGQSDWQRDLPALCRWAKANAFATIDLDKATAKDLKTLQDAGMQLGSVDLLQMGDITHGDPGKRRDIIAANVAHVKESAKLGAGIFFTIVGGEATRSRAENYKIAVESFAPIAEAAKTVGGYIAIEGYPGGSPHFPLLCTTPETCRMFINDIPEGLGINYDPSHLIRLGVDHIRFLRDFLSEIVHVHAKDTEIFPEAIYELGLYQPSAFEKPHGFGTNTWRYTIPGHGAARWTEIFNLLHRSGYPGIVSIELEDENFNGSEVGEKMGFIHSLNFLRGA